MSMKQFCDSIDDCYYGADGLCVYCDRRSMVPRKEFEPEEVEIEKDEPAR